MPAREPLDVAVVGAAGLVGGELLRLLARHPHVARVRAYSTSAEGRPVGDVHPALVSLRDLVFEEPHHEEAAASADVAFFALPHGESQAAMPAVLASAKGLVVDLAADHRVSSGDLYRRFYGEHASWDVVSRFVYGLVDVDKEAMHGARAIAAPGCFATASLLALYPLARADLFAGAPTIFAITGSTGSGATPKRTTHHPFRANNFFAYASEGHRHEAEIVDRLRDWTGEGGAEAHLLTHSAPLVRGIHATLGARLRVPLHDPASLYREAYAGSPFVRVRDTPPELAAVVATNDAHVHAVTREEGRFAVVQVAIDNLVKGAAGQAVQAMNLALDLEETSGLDQLGIYPC